MLVADVAKVDDDIIVLAVEVWLEVNVVGTLD